VLLDASDPGLAHDLGVNYAPKLADIGIGDPATVQTVTLTNPTPQQNPLGPGVVNFADPPNFAPTRVAVPAPEGFPLAKFQPGAVAGPEYSPFIRFKGSDVVYNTPIVATGNGPFDVTHHTNTGDRVLGLHIAGRSKPGRFAESWADLLFVKGLDAGQPIVYLSTDAGQPLTAVLERSIYVPALNTASFNGGDDFLGSARERLFGFINGQTGADNPNAQGSCTWSRTGMRPRTPPWQHQADQCPAPRRRPAERVRRLPHPERPLGTPTPTARCGTPSSACGPPKPSRKGSTSGRSTRTSCSTSPTCGPTC